MPINTLCLYYDFYSINVNHSPLKTQTGSGYFFGTKSVMHDGKQKKERR